MDNKSLTNFQITHVGVYRQPETHSQTVYVPWISFYVSGIKRFRTYLPGDRLIVDKKGGCDPFFRICLPGMKVDFQMDSNRENWVLMLYGLHLRYADDKSCVQLYDQGKWISLPYATDISREHVPAWRIEMEKIKEAYHNPTPQKTLYARLGVMNIIRYMMSSESEGQKRASSHTDKGVSIYRGDGGGFAPEEKLKTLLDDNANLTKNIMELSEECGYSCDHLRVLFEKRYQVKPLAYRNLRRKAYVMELIANSDLSVNEIAQKTGFKYPSHFCLDFKKEYGFTTKEAIKRFRYRTPS